MNSKIAEDVYNSFYTQYIESENEFQKQVAEYCAWNASQEYEEQYIAKLTDWDQEREQAEALWEAQMK